VQVQPCLNKGVVFFNAGEALFLADFIPPGCFTGPPLPKEKPVVTKKPDLPQQSESKKMAGSFFMDLEEKMNPKAPGSKQNRKMKKQKRKRQPPPWRR
jgi:putative RNA 2'-phosphotransferase